MGISITYNNSTIQSLGHAENLEIIPDDRQQLVKTVTNAGVPSVTVEDYGVVSDGEIISLSAVFSASDYSTLLSWWSARNRVAITLEDGSTISNARIVVRRSSYYDNLLSPFKTVQLEIWRV